MSDLDKVRRFLGGLAALRKLTVQSDEKIAAAAHERREAVNARLERLRPKVHTDPEAADEYQDLIKERARLDRTLALTRLY